MENCIYCTNHEKRDSLMIKVVDLKYSEIFLMSDQWHKGRCVVSAKGHYTEYFQMSPEEVAGFFTEMTKVSQAISNIYKPAKLNFLTLGDNMKHVHMHICPKYEDKESWGKFFNGFPKEELTDAEYTSAVEALKAEILK
ncbi:MAG: HIT family protein [Clostridia bacterium]